MSSRKFLLSDCLLQGAWDISYNLGHVDPIFRHPMSRAILFSVTNNFAGFGDIPIGQALSFLRPPQVARLLGYVKAIPGAASDALSENLFRSAMEARDLCSIKLLMANGINTNDFVLADGRGRYTLIERSAMLQDVATTKYLISQGADPNKSVSDHCYRNSWERRGALENALAYGGSFELVHTLLKAGANITIETVRLAVKYSRDKALVSLLWAESQDLDYCAWIESDVLTEMIEYSDPLFTETTLETIITTLDINDQNRTSIQMKLVDALDLAAKKGCLPLVQCLLKYTNLTQKTLSQAIKSGNQSLVSFLLDEGACPNGCPSSCYPVRTPLAEAILAGHRVIIDLLEERGAFEAIRQELPTLDSKLCTSGVLNPSLFESALGAAVKVNEWSMVQQLVNLCLDADADRSCLNGALLGAIRARKNDIAMMLLDEGANCDWQALHIALLCENETLVLKILETNLAYLGKSHIGGKLLEQALRWGNWPIVEKLCQFHKFSESHLTAGLVSAVANKNISLADICLRHGADLNAQVGAAHYYKGNYFDRISILTTAVYRGSEEVVRYLLSHEARKNDSDALSVAAVYHPSLVPVLLYEFSSVFTNGKGAYGSDALAFAIRAGNHDNIERLLHAHVAVNSFCFKPLWREQKTKYKDEDENGYVTDDYNIRTPLGWAIAQDGGQNIKLLKLLLDASGDPNSYVGEGRAIGHSDAQTALLSAIYTSNVSMVELLLSYGAEKDRAACRGVSRTPLQKPQRLAIWTWSDCSSTWTSTPTSRPHTLQAALLFNSQQSAATSPLSVSCSVEAQMCMHPLPSVKEGLPFREQRSMDA